MNLLKEIRSRIIASLTEEKAAGGWLARMSSEKRKEYLKKHPKSGAKHAEPSKVELEHR
jgi:hypothetical protein